jgi:predicted MFS family arabinose efflux permease
MNAGTITLLLLLYGLTGFVGNIGGGWIAGKDVRVALIGTSLLLGLAILALPVFGESQLAATVIVGIWGLAFGALPISIQTWMFRAAPQALETGAAIFVSAAQVALAGGALVGGLVVDSLGVPATMLMGGGFLLANAALIATFGRGPIAFPALAEQPAE